MSAGEERRVRLDGGELAYRLERGRRKHLYLSVTNEGVTVRAGLRTPLWQVEQALRHKEGWLRDRLREYGSSPAPELRPGEYFPVRGEYFPLRITQGGKKTSVFLREGALTVSLAGRAGEEALGQALEGFYRETARQAAGESLARMCALTGLVPSKVTVKKLRASWGRCSEKGEISLSLRLGAYPDPVVDYVVLHELCHLKEMNHSAAFWALVEHFMPQWKKQREALRFLPERARP